MRNRRGLSASVAVGCAVISGSMALAGPPPPLTPHSPVVSEMRWYLNSVTAEHIISSLQSAHRIGVKNSAPSDAPSEPTHLVFDGVDVTGKIGGHSLVLKGNAADVLRVTHVISMLDTAGQRISLTVRLLRYPFAAPPGERHEEEVGRSTVLVQNSSTGTIRLSETTLRTWTVVLAPHVESGQNLGVAMRVSVNTSIGTDKAPAQQIYTVDMNCQAQQSRPSRLLSYILPSVADARVRATNAPELNTRWQYVVEVTPTEVRP